jgi:hypothetical protein
VRYRAHCFFYEFRDVLFYFRSSATGSVTTLYGSAARETFGKELYGSYNLFLGMYNWLKLTNTQDEPINVTMTVYRGTEVAAKHGYEERPSR